MHEINVKRVGQFVRQLRLEALGHLEMQFAIEPLRRNLLLQLGKGHIEDLLLRAIAMSFDYPQPVSVGSLPDTFNVNTSQHALEAESEEPVLMVPTQE
jgi:hypothetical protein